MAKAKGTGGGSYGPNNSIMERATAPLVTEYGLGRDDFTNGRKFNKLWSKRRQEGWNAACRSEVLFLAQLAKDGKNFEGSVRRLKAAGVPLTKVA